MILRTLLKLAYSNVWIALSAGAQVFVQCRMLGSSVPPEACLLSFLSMFWVYTFAKAVHFDPTADALNDPERTQFLVSNRYLLIGLGVTGLFLGGFLSLRNGAGTPLIFVTPLLAGLLYDLKFLPKSFRYRRLKDITGVKGLVVASAWTVLTMGLPLQYGVEATYPAILCVGLWGFLNWFINTTYFDLGDIKGDREEDTQTIPVRLGYQKTRVLLQFLNLLALTVFLFGWQARIVGPTSWAASLLFLNNVYLLARAKDEDCDIQFECDVLADGLFIWASLYLVVSNLWL
jgi:4-hydroxybenzoate polyprenyltransferase